MTLPRAKAAGRELIDNTNALVMGQKRSGKTTLTEEIVTAKKQRLLIVDTLCKDYTRGQIFTDINQFGTAIAQLNETGEFRFIVRCPHHEEKVFSLLKFDNTLKRSPLVNATVVVEEISNFTSSQWIEPSLRDHYQYGGHNRNNLIGVTRFPYEINRIATRESDLILSFRQDERNDIEYFRQFRSQEECEKLRTLERGEYMVMKGSDQELLDFIEQP